MWCLNADDERPRVSECATTLHCFSWWYNKTAKETLIQDLRSDFGSRYNWAALSCTYTLSLRREEGISIVFASAKSQSTLRTFIIDAITISLPTPSLVFRIQCNERRNCVIALIRGNEVHYTAGLYKLFRRIVIQEPPPFLLFGIHQERILQCRTKG